MSRKLEAQASLNGSTGEMLAEFDADGVRISDELMEKQITLSWSEFETLCEEARVFKEAALIGGYMQPNQPKPPKEALS